jgi:uncharacterized protein (DUF1697 family)
MPVIVSLLRGVNLGPHRRLKMKELREVYESLGLQNVQTLLQSGNVIFTTRDKAGPKLAKRIEDAIEKTFGFHSDIVLRTTVELRDVIAKNPFAKRPGIEPNKLLVWFLASDPGAEAREKVREIKVEPEELKIADRELYIYYTIGMARPKIPMALIERTLKTVGTGRNWNTVTKLLEMAESIAL